MLFKMDFLARLRGGEVDLALRRWARPRVVVGTKVHTPVGLVEVLSIDVVDQLQRGDGPRAGYADEAAALAVLDAHGTGPIHRVSVRWAGEDPRIALRNTPLDDHQAAQLQARLARMDKASKDGAWTLRVLQCIHTHPQRRAADLAAQLGMDKARLKPRVRTLKGLGLTESLEVGYRLSTRGLSWVSRQAE